MSLPVGAPPTAEQVRRRILKRPRAAGLAAVAGVLGVVGVLGAVAPAALAQTETVSSFFGEDTISGPGTIAPGTPATYTLNIANPLFEPLSTVPEPAADQVLVGVTLPFGDGASVQSISNCSPLFFTAGGGVRSAATCTAPGLAPGASESVTITINTSNATKPGAFLIQAGGSYETLNPPGGSGVFGGEGVEMPVTVASAPTDVQVTGSSNNGSPAVGSQFAYTFQVKDNGPSGASGVTFDDTLPGAVQLAGNPTISGGGSCTADAASGAVHCDIGTLGVGQQATITVPAIATATGSFANTATIGMSGTDSRPDNDSVSVTVQPRSN